MSFTLSKELTSITFPDNLETNGCTWLTNEMVEDIYNNCKLLTWGCYNKNKAIRLKIIKKVPNYHLIIKD